MDNVNKTLYIPLYGKAYVSQKGLFLKDPKAEAIWQSEGFPLKGKARSKWLAYNMGMRGAVFDAWVKEKLSELPEAVVIHIGCGMDSRAQRIGAGNRLWFDLDFPEVIRERHRYYAQTETYRMLSYDLRDVAWFAHIPHNRPVILVMEGVSMYLSLEELKAWLAQLKERFSQISLLMDCYTTVSAKVSRYKNPINEVGVTQVHGLDDPGELGLTLVKEHDMAPLSLTDQLQGWEQWLVKRLFAGRLAKKIYRLYEFKS